MEKKNKIAMSFGFGMLSTLFCRSDKTAASERKKETAWLIALDRVI
jgi:hypothetical protein